MNLKIQLEVSCSRKEQTKKKENTITLTKNNKRPIFILHKKTMSDVNLANNIQITYAKFMIYLTEKFLI